MHRLFWLALGAFAIGTEGFMIAGLLPVPLMRSVSDLGTAGITAALFIFGVAAAFGNALGGRAADRFGSIRMMRTLLVGLVILFLVIAVSARMLPASIAGPAILAEIAVWGAMGWAFYPAQASRMVVLAPDAAVVALSLNASALYFGTALGAGLGAVVLTWATPADLGLVGALCGVGALGLLSLSLRLAERRSRGLAVQPAE